MDAYRGATQLAYAEPELEPECFGLDIEKKPKQNERPSVMQAMASGMSYKVEEQAGNIGDYIAGSDPLGSLLSHWECQIRSRDVYPHQARHLIEHVVYLPVHKHVPVHVLQRICEALEDTARVIDSKGNVVSSKL